MDDLNEMDSGETTWREWDYSAEVDPAGLMLLP